MQYILKMAKLIHHGIIGNAKVGNKTYKIYTQMEPAVYSTTNYGDYTISFSGSGIISVSTIISGYKKDILPETLIKEIKELKSNVVAIDSLCKILEENEIKCHVEKADKDKIIANLKSEKPVLINAWGKVGNSTHGFGNYFVLLAVKENGEVLLADSAHPNNTGWYNQNSLLSDMNMRDYMICIDD